MDIRSERGATLCGFVAIIVWSTTAALVRSVSEQFGPVGGAALIYTLGAILLMMLLGRPRFGGVSRFYLIAGSGMFVLFEICYSLALGYAVTSEQAIQVGVVVYLWPSLTVLMAVVMNAQPARWPIIPGTILALFGIAWVVTVDGLSLTNIASNVESNGLSFSLAAACAVIFALYCNVTRRYASGKNLVTTFFILTATALWVKYAISPEKLPSFTLNGSIELVAAGLSMAMGYAFWNIGMLRGNLTLLATTSYFGPVFSSMFAACWLGVTLTGQFWQGTLLVTIGSLICWQATRVKPIIRNLHLTDEAL